MHLILILAFSLFINFCAAQTYYVSPTGNDGNSGNTALDAFLTLQHASDISQAGDTIHVLPGAYVGFHHATSGTDSNPIVFLAESGVLINQPNALTQDGIYLQIADYVVIEGFEVYGMPNAGISLVISDGVTIRNNRCDSCGRWGIYTYQSESVSIENNVCSRSATDDGIYVAHKADFPRIYRNVCWGNNASGIHLNGGVSLTGDYVISQAYVSNNIIYENGLAGGSGINCDGVQSAYIANNLLYNNHGNGISLCQVDAGAASSGNRICNNTVVQSSDAQWCLNITNFSTGSIVFNNIFYTPHPLRGSIMIDSSSLDGLHSNFNVMIDRTSIDSGYSSITLSQWQAAVGVDSNSLISEASSLFIDTTAHDYHLKPAAAAIDLCPDTYFGTITDLVDLDGNGRPYGIAIDAGVFEYVLSSTVSVVPQEFLNWTNLPHNAPVSIFDVSGRLFATGHKETVAARLPSNIWFLFRTFDNSTKASKSGWVRITH